jgi:hypothetical protein
MRTTTTTTTTEVGGGSFVRAQSRELGRGGGEIWDGAEGSVGASLGVHCDGVAYGYSFVPGVGGFFVILITNKQKFETYY